LYIITKSSKIDKFISEKYNFNHFCGHIVSGRHLGFEAKSEVAQKRFSNSLV